MKNKMMKNTEHDHDHGFAHDLPNLLGRRRFLGGLAVFGLSTMAFPSFAMDCVALPWETAGPYPADGSNKKNWKIVNVLEQKAVIRQDLRSSFGELSGMANGLQLDLELTLQNANGCIPLEGYAVYLWACDATGNYSLYDITDQNYLRGVGISNQNGVVKFTTNFPGCYDGRWPHFHFEVFKNAESAVSGEKALLTSQIAIPEAEAALVYSKDVRYSNGTKNLSRISLDVDNVFSDNTSEQLTQQTLKLSGNPSLGYSGKLIIPIDFNADRRVQMAPPPNGGGRSWFWPW